MLIDSHHHFWRYSNEEYGWINDSMSLIRNDFLPRDLAIDIGRAGVEGVVTVQARTTLEETRWLLGLAGQYSFIRAVVGWVPLRDERLPEVLEGLCENFKFRGVREILQGKPAGALLGKQFNRGVALLKQFGLAYDILIFENQLSEATAFIDSHHEQVFILDHLAKPRIREGTIEPWASRIRELAQRENVYCKLSGMITEANPADWSADRLKPYFNVVLEAFGPSRLMFGSDWPVCLVGCEYARWLQTVKAWCAELSPPEQNEILSRTAMRAYQLK